MKILDVSTGFTQWDGVTPLPISGSNIQYTLKDAIVILANHSHLMALTNLEKMSFFVVGRATARPDAKEIGVEEADFAALKKAADANHVRSPAGRDDAGNQIPASEGPLFPPLVHGQLMQLLNKAPDKKE